MLSNDQRFRVQVTANDGKLVKIGLNRAIS